MEENVSKAKTPTSVGVTAPATPRPLKIKVEQKAFLAALKLVRQVIDRKASIPILSHVHLSAHDCVLTVVGTDLVTWLVATVPCDGEGEAVVDAVALATAVDACAPKSKAKDVGPRIALELVPAKTRGGVTVVKVRGAAELSVNASADVVDYPKGLAVSNVLQIVTYDACELLAALDFVWPAISTDWTRYHLNGVLFKRDAVVSTDGHRLHLHGDLPVVGLQREYLVPRRSIGALRALLKGRKAILHSEWGAATVCFTVDGVTLTVKLIDAQFPPHEQIMPNAEYCESGFIANRVQFLAALKAVAPMTKETTGGAVLQAFGAELSVSADNPDAGEAKAVFAGTPRKGNFKIGVNVYYYIELIERLDTDLVTVMVSDKLSPMRVDCGAKTAIIMPMRM